ncbi:MAG TPA: monovalent cation/H(+) antiporter subunit G [Sediminispirochaeta sp.]|nr:monovalent cation/H(+) antiporter subunit G [Sediminispirochaeta sp.]
MNYLAALFFVVGIFFAVTGHIGLLRAPDFFTRLQASSTCSTTSVLSILVASMIISGLSPFTGRVAAITLFFAISSPVSTHIIARYAWEEGIVPWRRLK